MRRKVITVIELVIIIFVVLAGGYKLYHNYKDDYPPPGTPTQTVRFHKQPL